MSDLSKAEKKFLQQLLLTKLTDSKRIIQSSEQSLHNKQLPNYTLDVHEKQLKRQHGIVTTCKAILKKLS